MRGILLALLSITACYAPTIPAGVPCSTSGGCPEGQMCTAGVCRLPGAGGDAGADAGGDGVEIDAFNPDDRDGDGRLNSVDNCPDVANPDQANEDGDKFGDACDPCPIDRNDAPADRDHDGVADACDPHPDTPGDAIVLFEGFHGGLPAWQPTPNWHAAAGGEAIEVTATANADEVIVVPASATDHITATASVVVTQLPTSTFGHSLGWAIPYEATSYNGISCDMVDDRGRFVGIWDDFKDVGVGSSDFAWSNNIEYRIVMAHQGTSYSCTLVEPGGMQHGVSGTSDSVPSVPSIAMRAYAITGRVNWVMIVRSP